MADLRIRLEAERAEARRAKMEASSTIKQYEALVQRLRREADASEPLQCALHGQTSNCQASAAAGTASRHSCASHASISQRSHIPAHRRRVWSPRVVWQHAMLDGWFCTHHHILHCCSAGAEEVCRLRGLQASQAAAASSAYEQGAASDAGSPHLHQELMQLHR